MEYKFTSSQSQDLSVKPHFLYFFQEKSERHALFGCHRQSIYMRDVISRLLINVYDAPRDVCLHEI